MTGLSGGKAASPALLRSLTSPGSRHPAGPGSEDLRGRSLFQTWGAPCLHGALARLQAALPARAAAAHRQASLPTSPRPAVAEAASPRQEAPSLISYKCLSEGGGLSECRGRQSRRSLTPCGPSVGLYCPGKDSWDLPMSGPGTVTAKIQTEETKAPRRSGDWPGSLSMQRLEAFSTAPTL